MLVCGRCGHHNEDRARFCGSCDSYLDFSTTRRVKGDQAAQEAEASGQPPSRQAADPGPPRGGWDPPPPGPDPRHGAASRAGESTDPDLFGRDELVGDDDYGSLMDDLAALGYGQEDRESAAAAIARETRPAWPTGGQEQQPYRDQPPPDWSARGQRSQPAQSFQANPAEAVLPQAVRPQQPKPPTPPDPDPEPGIHAVLPGERRHASVAAQTTDPEPAGPAATALRPGEVACPNCGRGNPQGTRFCRCGHQLVATVRPQAPPPTTTTRQIPVPWWRRLLGQARGGRYGLSGNARVQYSRALEVRTQLVRGAMLLGALGIGVSLIGPWGFRTWVADQFANITQRYQPVAVRQAAVVGEAPEQESFPARFATDGRPDRAWAVGWNTETPPLIDEPCSTVQGPAASALAVTFAKQSKVDRVTVRSGLDREKQKELASKQSSPKTLDVLFSDGTCERLELKNDFSKQRFRVGAKSAEGAVVSVVDVYPAVNGPGDVVAIGEITFEARP